MDINVSHCHQSVYEIVTNTVERSFTFLLQHSASSGAIVLEENEKGVSVGDPLIKDSTPLHCANLFSIKQEQVSSEMFVLMSSAVMHPLKRASYL